MLFETLRNFDIILGSGSPRRKYLLEEMGLKFRVLVNNSLEETWPEEISEEEIPVYLAELKGRHILEEVGEDQLLITADTIVLMGEEVINKPSGPDDAFRMLRQLSGNKHEVLTGVSFRSGKRRHSFCASSLVWFAELTDAEINYYIDHFNPFDKAGAYGIQDWIGYIGVEKIEGSYFNVMGLPLQRMYHELKGFIGDE
jgi:septum formation protein